MSTKVTHVTLTFDLVNLKRPLRCVINKVMWSEISVINSSQDNEGRSCLHFLQVTLVTLTLNRVNPRSIGVMSLPRPISVWTMIALWQVVLKKMSKNYVLLKKPYDLDPGPSEPKNQYKPCSCHNQSASKIWKLFVE